MFGELIIMIVYLPILTLEGVEGKLFRPMALTVIFALAGSMVLSLTLMPVLASLMLPKRIDEREPLLIRMLKRLYAPVLRFTMHHKLAVLGFALCLLVVAFGMIAPNLGSEFIPKLSEGSIVVNIIRLAGIDLEESIRYNTQMEKALLAAFPDEIQYAWSRIGTAEVATDPMGVELSDIFITLKPRSQWKRARTQDELTALIQKELRDLPGQRLAMTQPIEMRMNEMISGVRSDVAAILYGDDFDVLVKKAAEIERVLKSIPGAADVSTEQVTGQPVLQIRINQDEIARYGIPAKTVLDLVESLGSKQLGEVYEGQLRFPLIVRLPEKVRASPEAIGAILVTTPSGQRIPLSRLATIETVEGPSTIKREWYQRRITVSANVRGRDMGSFVAEAQKEGRRPGAIAARPLSRRVGRPVREPPAGPNAPDGRRAACPGAHLRAALPDVPERDRRLAGVHRRAVRLGRRHLRPLDAGHAVFDLRGRRVCGPLRRRRARRHALVSYIRQLRRQGVPLEEAVEDAAMTRLRPVLMTTLVASLGFVPMAFNTGMGAEVQRPLATVVIGGVFSAMVMSLLVLRVLYMVFSGPVGPKKRDIHQADTDSRRVPGLVSASFPEGGTDDGVDASKSILRDGDGGPDGRRLRQQRDEGA